MHRTNFPGEGNRNEGMDLLYGLIIQREVLQQAISVDNVVPTPLPLTALQYRKSLHIFNNAANPVYIGSSTVTTATGFPIYPRGYMQIQIEDGVTLYAIAGVAAQEIRIIEGA